MATPVVVNAGNHVNVRAGMQRKTENGAAEQLKQIPEFSVASECNRRDAKDQGRLGTNGLESQRKNGQGERGLEKMRNTTSENVGEIYRES